MTIKAFLIAFVIVFSWPLMAMNADVRVALIGDSHVEALGPLLSAAAKQHSRLLKFEAHRGSRAANSLRHPSWGKWLEDFDPQIVIVNLGTNESRSRRRVADLPRSFQSFADYLANGGKRQVVWIMPPRLKKVRNLPAVWSGLKRLHGVAILNFADKKYEMRQDGVRLTARGYGHWAKDIAHDLKI